MVPGYVVCQPGGRGTVGARQGGTPGGAVPGGEWSGWGEWSVGWVNNCETEVCISATPRFLLFVCVKSKFFFFNFVLRLRFDLQKIRF